jgi:Putative beta barrel porin-7 (BBP7)
MRNRHYFSIFSMLIALICCRPLAAQHWFEYSAPPRDMDWQLFAPVDDYLFESDEGRDPGEGYFFNSNRGRFWMMRPGRAPIGSDVPVQGQVFASSNIQYVYPTAGSPIRGLVLGRGDFITQSNAVDDAYVAHSEGWGNQFEFGWVEDDHGWMISVIQGVDTNRTELYGFDDKRLNQLAAAQGLNGIDGRPDQDGTGTGTVRNPVAPVAGSASILARDGLLEVGVIFEDPNNLLFGFADRDGNGVADDVNNDGVITAADRVRIAAVFDDMRVDNATHLNSAEVMAVKRKKRLPGGGNAEAFLGVRFLELDDRFDVLARGGTLSDTFWNQRALNRIVGPQVGLRFSQSHNRWTSVIQGRFTAGANFLSVRQDGVLANHILSGFTGVPDQLGSHAFSHRLSDEQFSPIGEIGYQTSFLMTRGVALKAAWTGMFMGGITRSANTVIYRIPTFGIRHRQEETFAHGVTFGVEINR